MKRSVIFIVLGCAVSTLLAGCAASQPASRSAALTAPLTTTGSATLTPAALDMLTESGSWSSSERVLDTANDRLTQRCMQKLNLPYTADKTTVVDNSNEAQVINLARRKQSGYDLEPSSAQNSQSSLADRPQDAYLASLSPSAQQHYTAALFGPTADRVTINLPGGGQATYPGTGCQAQAIHSLDPDVATWALFEYVPQQLGDQLADQLFGAAAYQAALGRWRACMATRSLHFASPEAAAKSLATSYQSQGPSATLRQQEISTAVADGNCAAQVHLPAAALASKRTLAASLPEQDRRNLVTLANDRTAAVRNAQAVLGQS